MIDIKYLKRLEWPEILGCVAEKSYMPEGRQQIEDFQPNLTPDQIESRWAKTDELSKLKSMGYEPPLLEVASITGVVRAAEVGKVLDGAQLRDIAICLDSTARVHRFARDFHANCAVLSEYEQKLVPIPDLFKGIDRAIDERGEIRDDASELLGKIRKQKIRQRESIVAKLNKLLKDTELEKYIQDDYYTERGDRYVIPIRLDGRGRIKGSIRDTSNSGQTLFIEPEAVAVANEELQELELQEKLEIIRIFKELSSQTAVNGAVLQANYDLLLDLDIHNALAQFAHRIGATKPMLSNVPRIFLKKAAHPLLLFRGGKAVANDIELEAEQRGLIVSGPNAGGKTVVLKTLGLIHLMAKAGMLVPAGPESELFLFSRVFIEMGDAQSIAESLSTFSGHIKGLSQILAVADRSDLVLLDELAVGTEPQTGAALAQAITEHLADNQIFSAVTTHYDDLKTIAIEDKRLRNGSMEYSAETLAPTYRLVFDTPGKSFGLEVAAQTGMPEHIIQRARFLRGNSSEALERSLEQLGAARQKLDQALSQVDEKIRLAENEKSRWEHERKLLAQNRKKALEALKSHYDQRLRDLEEEAKKLTKQLAKKVKTAGSGGDSQEDRTKLRDALKDMAKGISNISAQDDSEPEQVGSPVESMDRLDVGDEVYVVALKQRGIVQEKLGGKLSQVAVNIGPTVTKVPATALQLVTKKSARPREELKAPKISAERKTGKAPPVVVKTQLNTVDLRGLTVEEGLESLWKFADSAVMRGEVAIIAIHGTGPLRDGLRQAISLESPYNCHIEPGARELGGDGVTVIFFS